MPIHVNKYENLSIPSENLSIPSENLSIPSENQTTYNIVTF